MHVIQQKLLRLAETYNLGNMPLRDIGKIIGEDHPQLIKHHLEQLEKKELIEWDKERKIIRRRGIGAISNADFLTVPVLGAANCGPALLYATPNVDEHIKVSKSLLKGRTKVFAIRAVGYSMNRASIDGKAIDEGDYVIIDPDDHDVNTNDYVLSIIDEMANIKKIVLDDVHNQIALISESNVNYPPIYIDKSEATKYFLNGKVIQVIKQMKK
jgi:SOS-response transcriptional repressor LexA